MDTISGGVCIKRNFMKMIGYDSSLGKAIDQVKAALNYPNNGLPILLYGEKELARNYYVMKCMNMLLIMEYLTPIINYAK